MKNLILLLAMTALMSSCRVMKKSKTSADSTVVRTEQTTGSWEKVTVTETFKTANEPLAVSDERTREKELTKKAVRLSGVEARVVAPFDSAQGDKKRKPGILKRFFKQPPSPLTINPLPQTTPPLLTRTTTIERGTYSQQKQEQKQIHTAEKTKAVESGLATSKRVLPIAGGLIILLLICVILYRSKQRNY